jgi:chromosome segregation ATPase
MDQELIAFLDEHFRETTRQIGEFRKELRQEIGTLRTETMSRFEQVDEAIRKTQDDVRHTQVLVEGLRSDLQAVAEGVVGANERIDALRKEMKQEIKEVRHEVRLSYTDLDNRVRPLEEWRKRIGEDPSALVRRKSGKKT